MRVVVMPMAGRGSRFKEVHPCKVKADVHGVPMFVHSIQNLGCSFDRVILIARREHEIGLYCSELGLTDYTIVEIDEETDGPMDTVLKARSLIYDDEEIIIANSDQVMCWNGDWALDWLKSRGAVGGIPTMTKKSSRHSYVRIDENYPGKIAEVREKERISERATIGFYWFSQAKDLWSAAERMYEFNDRAPNGEFYVGPVYNYLEGLILEYPLCEFWSIGEPDNLEAYLNKDYESLKND